MREWVDRKRTSFPPREHGEDARHGEAEADSADALHETAPLDPPLGDERRADQLHPALGGSLGGPRWASVCACGWMDGIKEWKGRMRGKGACVMDSPARNTG